MKPQAPFSLGLLLSTAALGLSSALLAPPASAQVRFQPPPMSSPGNREAGGLRSDTCAATTEGTGLTAIVPNTNVGLTTQSSPALFAYIPSNNAARAELRLVDEDSGDEVFSGEIKMAPATNASSPYKYQPSVVKVSLPSSQPLEAGKNYIWAVMLVCNLDNRAEDIVTTAVVQKADNAYLQNLAPDVKAELANVASASSQEKLAIYSSAGMWQDLLNELSNLAKANPASYADEWNSLLTDQGLGAIANAPLYESTLSPLSP